MRPLLLLFASVSLVACSGSKADHVMDTVFDKCAPLLLAPEDASAGELEAVAQAAAMWNGRAGTSLLLEGGDDVPRLPIRFERGGIGFGVYQDELGVIVINSRLTDLRERAITIAHEVGHAFGLWHIERNERRSVMNPANLTVAPNDADARDLDALWAPCAPAVAQLE